jgi:putative endonuclease
MDKGLYVYIALCKDSSYYVGVTNNVEKRIAQHNYGEDSNAYTFYRRPIKLVWQNKFSNNLEAIEWEKKIKGWTRKKKEALMKGDFDLIHELAKCQNDTNSKFNE